MGRTAARSSGSLGPQEDRHADRLGHDHFEAIPGIEMAGVALADDTAHADGAPTYRTTRACQEFGRPSAAPSRDLALSPATWRKRI